ncbi:MAG: MBL fold metallo-hydrolase [Legionella sp.]|jgi:ribonuclease BN (tRNA processing enzyme)
MSLKMIFLGSGSAFTVGFENYQSNILFELDGDSLLIDAGADIRHALFEQKRSYNDVNNVYITHLHGDHSGGLEWLALTRFFKEDSKGLPNLYISETLVDDLWNKTLSGGLSTIPNRQACLGTYFNLHPIKHHEGFIWHSIYFKLVQTVHYYNDYELMPSFGLLFTYNKKRIFFTSDTQSAPEQLSAFYQEADIIFHDCETQEHKSGVHAHYSDLLQLPLEIRNKMWLYHYNPGNLPNAKKDGFLGFVVKGQTFTF